MKNFKSVLSSVLLSLVYLSGCNSNTTCHGCTDSSSSSTGNTTFSDINTATYSDNSSTSETTTEIFGSSSSGTSENSGTSETSESTNISTSENIPVCGDGFKDHSEKCDNGSENKKPEDAEEGQCIIDSCEIAICGDFLKNKDEECDGEENCNDCYLCGNGIVAPTEECDDNNLNILDGCNNCKIEHVAFVTSVPFTGKLGGISGANTICQNLANEASKNDNFKFGDLKFNAWISDDKQSPYDFFSQKLRNFKGIIRKPGGKGLGQDIVADNGWDDIVGNSLYSRLDYDEYGNHVKDVVHVWSNVNAPLNQQNYCEIGDFSWVSESEKNYGNIGFTGAINKDWTFYDKEINDIKCSQQHRLYCFSQ